MSQLTRRGFLSILTGALSLFGLKGSAWALPKWQPKRQERGEWYRDSYALESWPSRTGRDSEGYLHCKGFFFDWLSLCESGVKNHYDVFQSGDTARQFCERVAALLDPGSIPIAVSRPANMNGLIVQVANLTWPRVERCAVFPIELFEGHIPAGWFA